MNYLNKFMDGIYLPIPKMQNNSMAKPKTSRTLHTNDEQSIEILYGYGDKQTNMQIEENSSVDMM